MEYALLVVTVASAALAFIGMKRLNRTGSPVYLRAVRSAEGG